MSPSRLFALVLALVLAGCAGDAAPEAGTPPRGGAERGPSGLPAEGRNPLARLIVQAVRDGRGQVVARDLLAVGLRPDERMVAARLIGSQGRTLDADPAEVRHGERLGGMRLDPRVALRGGSNTGVGVTLSLDLFSDAPDPPPLPEGKRAWVRIPLPPGTETDDWRAEAILENAFGETQTLTAGP
jgi:hypothetical protein